MSGKARFERRVKDLEALGHRGSATDNEERAADYLVEEMQEAGIHAGKEPFSSGSSSLGARILVHVAVAVCGLVLLFLWPLLTLLIGVLVLVSFVGEMDTRFRLLGYLLQRQRSHNVVGSVAPSAGQPLQRIILCAHIDTQRTGLIWRGKLAAPVSRLLQRAPGPVRSPLFLVVLLTGCEETGALGAAAWLDAHRADLKQTTNLFFVIDTLGYGAPRFLGGEHSLATTPFRYPPDLVDLCKNVAHRRGLSKAGPYVLPTFSDGMAFMVRGIQGVAVLTFEEDVTMPNYHQMGDTSANMDFNVGWHAVEYCWDLLLAIRRHLEQGGAGAPSQSVEQARAPQQR
jgi:hypothetical protein